MIIKNKTTNLLQFFYLKFKRLVFSNSFIFFFIIFGARVLQLAQLYFTETPTGGAFVEKPFQGFICAVIVNITAFSFFAMLFSLTSLLNEFKKNFFLYLIYIFTSIHLILCVVDDQIMRWMGQHLTTSFISTYSIFRLDPSITSNILQNGYFSFFLSFILVLIPLLLLFFATRKSKPLALQETCVLICLFAILILVCGNAHLFLKPCRIRWNSIKPTYLTFLEEIQYNWTHRTKPSHFEQGISILGGNPSSDYPFYHKVEKEDSLINAFKTLPLEQKKDVILLSLESFRGWVGDFRIGSNCKRMPNLCELSKTGTTFPYTYSVGYPSTEGMLGLQLGIWSHPNKVFLSSFMNTKTISLPDILGKAGYHRIILTAAEPSFDNFNPWFDKWFDYFEYNPKNSTDIPLANRFKAIYESRPKNKPVYFEWINFVTHTPFNVPKSYDEPAKTSNERYAQAVSYLDSALGIIFDVIKKSPRANETIIIVTGDHSIANSKAQKKLDVLGEANSTYTWTSFYWTGPGIEKNKYILNPCSHVDFAPTLLSLLGIDASNHFVGKNLFKDSLEAVFSFRHSDAVMRKDSVAIFARMNFPAFSHARKQSKIVDWDTTETIGNFISETKLPLNVNAAADSLLNAVNAWTWILDKKLLAPIQDN